MTDLVAVTDFGASTVAGSNGLLLGGVPRSRSREKGGPKWEYLFHSLVTCRTCGGTGKHHFGECVVCGGTGQTVNLRPITRDSRTGRIVRERPNLETGVSPKSKFCIPFPQVQEVLNKTRQIDY